MWKAAILSVFLLGCSLQFTSSYLIKGDDVLLYFSEVNVTVRKSGVEKVESVNFNSNNTIVDYEVSNPDTEGRLVVLKLLNNPSKIVETLNINLTVTRGGDYWKVTNITAAVKGTVGTESYNAQAAAARFISSFPIEAPMNKSFHCGSFGDIYPAFPAPGQVVPFGNFTPVIQIFGLQMQAFNASVDEFGEAWECVGFFTAGIWSGIFVTALLIGILTWGLAMIMDVKTMDRFDDPKGKQVSFGGAE